MDDNLIIPDDISMDKLAKEYSKIKAKTFSSAQNITSFSINVPRKYKLVTPKLNYNSIKTSIYKITKLSEKSLEFLRKYKHSTRNIEDKQYIKELISLRQKIIKKLHKLDLNTQIHTLEVPFYNFEPNIKFKKQIIMTQFLIINQYTKMLDTIPSCILKNQLRNLKNMECELSTKIMLLFYN